MVVRNKKVDTDRSSETEIPPRSTGLPKQSILADNTLSMVVLGFSVLSLGLSVYGITGGHLERYAQTQHVSSTVYATTADATIGQAAGSDSANTAVESDSSDVHTTAEDGAREDTVYTEQEKAEKVLEDARKIVADAQKAEEAKVAEEAEREAAVKEAAVKAQAEADAKMDAKLASMRLRVKPDRDLGDVYYYVVESGDQLSDLAKHFDVSAGQLMELNFISDADHIYVGEVLFMPTGYSVTP